MSREKRLANEAKQWSLEGCVEFKGSHAVWHRSGKPQFRLLIPLSYPFEPPCTHLTTHITRPLRLEAWVLTLLAISGTEDLNRKDMRNTCLHKWCPVNRLSEVFFELEFCRVYRQLSRWTFPYALSDDLWRHLLTVL